MQLQHRLIAALAAAPFLLSANDNFVDAESIVYQGALISRSGDTNDATVEPGEPNPLGALEITASYWYALSTPEAARVEIVAETSNVDALLAVYTGTTIDDLEVASRYNTMDFPAVSRRGRNSTANPIAGEPLSQYARVTLDIIPGETYYIWVSSEGNTRGAYTLNVAPTRNNLTPVLELLPPRSEWSSLIHRDAADTPIAPDTEDPDFYTTWQTPAGYNGPAFSAPTPAPIGYGSINAFKLPTAKGLWLPAIDTAPPSGTRYTSYHRTSFTPPVNVTSLAVEGVFDDGAIFYLNGNEVGRINMPEGASPNNWTQLAQFQSIPDIGDTEDQIQYLTINELDLPAGQPVDLAVSLHNQSASSSDMGFDLRVFAAGASLPAGLIELTITPTNSPASYRLEWTGLTGKAYNIERSTDLSINSWTVVNSAPIEAISDATILEFVSANTSSHFWRVVTTDPAP